MEWWWLIKILDKYREASGQKLSKDKTSIFFSQNTSLSMRTKISQMFGIQASQSYDKYLGFPTLVGKSRSKALRNIRDKVWNCLHNWKVKLLLQAGNEILLKLSSKQFPCIV